MPTIDTVRPINIKGEIAKRRIFVDIPFLNIKLNRIIIAEKIKIQKPYYRSQ